MRVNSFSLLIPQGVERDSGHVELPHNMVYTLRLGNHNTNRRCDAEVTVDCKTIGCFRIDACGTLIVERGVNDTGKFTFFKSDSPEAIAADVGSVQKDMRGLIQVRFKPEKASSNVHPRNTLQTSPQEWVSKGGIHPRGMSPVPMSFNAGPELLRSFAPGEQTEKTCGGITGLTGKSQQTFHNVAVLDYDEANEVLISVRLVCNNNAVRPLLGVPRSNPVPASVE